MTYFKARLPLLSVVLVALITMLFSASCGCGSGSSAVGPAAPNYDSYVSDPVTSKPWSPRDDYYDPVYRDVSIYQSDILHTRWSIASHFIEEIGFNRVERGGADNIEDWGRLAFLPYDRVGPARLPADMAYAVYGFKTYEFSDDLVYPVYIELDWYDEPNPNDVWIGAHTDQTGESRWIWTQPFHDMTVQLSPLWLFRSPDRYQTVYVAVVVTGGAPCVLEEVRLRQYRY